MRVTKLLSIEMGAHKFYFKITSVKWNVQVFLQPHKHIQTAKTILIFYSFIIYRGIVDCTRNEEGKLFSFPTKSSPN